MTLMKSNTTRRSQPMIMSRLRRPTSKSTTTVLCPRIARPALIAAEEVVLPTPPLPEVTTMTLLTNASFPSGLLERGDAQLLALEIDLHEVARNVRAQRLAGAVKPGNGQQFGVQRMAE